MAAEAERVRSTAWRLATSFVRRALALAFALLVLGAPAESRAGEDADRAEAAFREGNRAFAEGDYHAAFDAYRAAWSLKQSFDIACNLGRTELELGLSRDAAEHLDYCLRTFSVSSRDEVRDANKRFQELFQRVRREVGGLAIEVRPAGAEITVDGASYGAAPLEREIFVTPGQHVVRAHLPGFRDEQRSIHAEPGSSLAVTITLAVAAPKSAAVAPAATTPAAERRHRMQPRTIVVISGAAASLVALGIGVGFALDAGHAHDDASAHGQAANQGGGGCVTPAASAECVALHDAVNRENRSRDRADVALMTGAVLGAATLGAWLLVPDRSTPKVGTLRASPWVGRQTSGLVIAGTY